MIRTTPSLFARCAFSALTLAGVTLAQAPIATVPLRVLPPAADAPPLPVVATMESSRAIDLVICLDVSGSMNGLINAARQNLWSIVNDMATLQPQPELRVALLTYGSPAFGMDTGFVSIQTGLTTDLDLVSEKLFSLKTNGGSEYVARVVKRSLEDLQWSSDPRALKLIFVAGNEAATQDPAFDAMQLAGRAISAGVLVNTIYCGNQQKPEAEGWRQVARRADGKFAAIEQDQQVVIETPFDRPLSDLSTKLNSTYVVYGRERGAWAGNQVRQDGNASSLNVAAAAQRCLTKAGALYCNPRYDLVDALKQPKFDLSKIKKEDLPEELRTLTPEQLKAHVAKKGKERAAIQKQVAELGKKRDAFVLAERKKRSQAGEKVFEDAILESVRAQARSRGFERRAEPKVQDPSPEKDGLKTDGPKKKGASEKVLDKRFVEVVQDAVKTYRNFPRVTGSPKIAPEDCRLPGPFARASEASKEHGGKLYLLYARKAEGANYVFEGKPAEVGQTLVKEAWERVKGLPQGETEASKSYPLGLTYELGLERHHAGDSHGLFVMHKLADGTPGTDQGWVYGTLDKNGMVTSAGKVASCIKCHRDAPNDRRFGLE